MAGLRLRLRDRPAGDAQIRHGRPPRLLRRRYPLAQALRLPSARCADTLGRCGRMKFSLEWLRQHLETDASATAIADKLTAIGLEVEGLSNPAEALAPVGDAFTTYAGLDDPVFDVNVTPNRQDCMGVRGIARDLAAAGMGRLKPLAVPQIEGGFRCPVPIRIDDPDGCPAFFGCAVRGVTNGGSPEWMQRRLKSAGQRPISALVDI